MQENEFFSLEEKKYIFYQTIASFLAKISIYPFKPPNKNLFQASGSSLSFFKSVDEEFIDLLKKFIFVEINENKDLDIYISESFLNFFIIISFSLYWIPTFSHSEDVVFNSVEDYYNFLFFCILILSHDIKIEQLESFGKFSVNVYKALEILSYKGSLANFLDYILSESTLKPYITDEFSRFITATFTKLDFKVRNELFKKFSALDPILLSNFLNTFSPERISSKVFIYVSSSLEETSLPKKFSGPLLDKGAIKFSFYRESSRPVKHINLNKDLLISILERNFNSFEKHAKEYIESIKGSEPPPKGYYLNPFLDFELFIQNLDKLNIVEKDYSNFLSFRFFPFFLLFYYRGFFSNFRIVKEKDKNSFRYSLKFENFFLQRRKFFEYSRIFNKNRVGKGTIILDSTDPIDSYERWRNERWNTFHEKYISERYFRYFSSANELNFDPIKLVQIAENLISTALSSEHGTMRAHSEQELSNIHLIDHLCDLLINGKNYPKLEFRPVAQTEEFTIPSAFKFTFYDFSKDKNYLFSYYNYFIDSSKASIILALLLGFFKLEKIKG